MSTPHIFLSKDVSEGGNNAPAPAGSTQRRIPTQRRSRERVERILTVATKLIAERGGEAMTMSELADRAGVSIGSLYQYFPDKSSVLRTLAEEYNAQGLACTEAEWAKVTSEASLKLALHRVVDGYYAMFRSEPVMHYIWQATQSDKTLQDLDASDVAAHAEALQAVLVRLRPEHDRNALKTLAMLTTQLMATAVRLAASLKRAEGDDVIETFKRMLPNNLLGVLNKPSKRA